MHHASTQPRGSNGRFAKRLPDNVTPIYADTYAPEVEFGGNYHTAQIYSMGFEFAFMGDVNGVHKQACPFVYCKDFLHDAVWAMVNKTQWQIYSFKYDYTKNTHLNMNNCVFAFRNTDYSTKKEEFHAQREACQEFLNGIEAKLGFQPTQIYEVDHGDIPCWLIVGDKGWQHAPPLVGLFTLFIRLGFIHQKGESSDETLEKAKTGKIKITDKSGYAGRNDCSYIVSSWKGIQTIFKHGLDIFHKTIEENYPADLPKKGTSLHDGYGPVSFTKGLPKRSMPHWYRSEIWK